MPDTLNKTPSTIENGWLHPAWHVLSPNCDDRPDSCDISLLVIHNISLPPGQFGGENIQQFFSNNLNTQLHPYFTEIKDLKVSSHVLIDREGKVTQFVPFHRRAWHAGVSNYRGRAACNDFAIGIELEGQDDLPYTDMQYQQLIAITKLLCECYPALALKNDGEKSDSEKSGNEKNEGELPIVGHCDIAPERKTDPGEAFDWRRYRLALKA